VLPARTALARQVAPVHGADREAARDATTRARARLNRLLEAEDRRAATERGHRPAEPRDQAGDVAAGCPAALLRAGEDAIAHALSLSGAGGRLTDDDAAWLTVLLGYLPVRDLAWQRTAGRPEHVALWADLTRRAGASQAAAPASLLAFAAWRSGNGALAAVAADRALQASPGYTMAALIAELLRLAIPPSEFDAWPAPGGD
jgi:hypothetical protein